MFTKTLLGKQNFIEITRDVLKFRSIIFLSKLRIQNMQYFKFLSLEPMEILLVFEERDVTSVLIAHWPRAQLRQCWPSWLYFALATPTTVLVSCWDGGGVQCRLHDGGSARLLRLLLYRSRPPISDTILH